MRSLRHAAEAPLLPPQQRALINVTPSHYRDARVNG
jgi:hypothetical protein